MKKTIYILIVMTAMLFALAACNTEEGARENQQNNMRQVSFGPEDQGIQPHQGERTDKSIQQHRFDANIPFEGLNPNGTYSNSGDMNSYEEADRYAQGDDKMGSNKERIDQVDGSFKDEVVRLTNEAREKNGLKPLKMSPAVNEVAQTKSEDMAEKDYFSHTSPTYGSPFDMLKQFGVDYRTAAENIAAGQQTPKQVVDAWLNSSGHRKNIMNQNLTHIGVGFAQDGQYWTQMFIGK
ncbi:CAP domain-containing protein [Halobacillus litoralis]|uniref:CAP domain-containing protein n=1 Tax=Halobacillus litoralis TaxID=45668 RepID=UPI001CD6932B|nr:CAP domain-containing protein [Halobacillus litoralis]MCA0971255.1 CAP domain-containing protein [Halobacillus litoralis]